MNVNYAENRGNTPKIITFGAVNKCPTFATTNFGIESRLSRISLEKYRNKFNKLVKLHENRPYNVDLGTIADGANARINIEVTDEFKKAFAEIYPPTSNQKKKNPFTGILNRLKSLFDHFTPNVLRRDKNGNKEYITISSTSGHYTPDAWLGTLKHADEYIAMLLKKKWLYKI